MQGANRVRPRARTAGAYDRVDARGSGGTQHVSILRQPVIPSGNLRPRTARAHRDRLHHAIGIGSERLGGNTALIARCPRVAATTVCDVVAPLHGQIPFHDRGRVSLGDVELDVRASEGYGPIQSGAKKKVSRARRRRLCHRPRNVHHGAGRDASQRQTTHALVLINRICHCCRYVGVLHLCRLVADHDAGGAQYADPFNRQRLMRRRECKRLLGQTTRSVLVDDLHRPSVSLLPAPVGLQTKPRLLQEHHERLSRSARRIDGQAQHGIGRQRRQRR